MARATTGIAYLTLGLVILGGLVFTVFVTVPAWSAWRAARVQLEEKVGARDQRRNFLADIDARTAELRTYEREARALGVTFPETKAPADLAAIVHGLSVRNGVIVESVGEVQIRRASVQAPAANPPTAGAREAEVVGGGGPRGGALPQAAPSAPVYEFSLSGHGTYAQIRAFLRDLERSLRLFDLPAVEITGGNLGEASIVRARITITTYLAEP